MRGTLGGGVLGASPEELERAMCEVLEHRRDRGGGAERVSAGNNTGK